MSGARELIILVDPPTGRADSLNTGLGWLAANIPAELAEVRVLAFGSMTLAYPEAMTALMRLVRVRRPRVVGFNIHCTTYRTVLAMVAELRAGYDGTVVIGGPHAVYKQGAVLDECPGADALVVGEGEAVFAELCARPRGDYHGLSGVLFRAGERIISNPPGTARRDWGQLRHPDYRQFGIREITRDYPVATSRGCPFRCCFCNPHMGGGWRPRPLAAVFDELEFARREFAISSFAVSEPVFNMQEERVLEFCAELMRRDWRLPWWNPSGMRADGITPRLVQTLKQAGCTHIKIGVETLVPEIYPLVNKGEKLETIIHAIRTIKAGGMPLWGSFIIGLPGDTLATARENYRLSRQYDFDFTEWSLLVPYPGTAAHAWMEKNGTIHHSFETAHQVAVDAVGEDEVKVACSTPEFTLAERRQAFYEINWRSGNYLFPADGSAIAKAMAIMRGIIRYDAARLPWHTLNLARRLRQRRQRQQRGPRYRFTPDALA